MTKVKQMNKSLLKALLLVFLVFSGINGVFAEANIEKGEKLFKQECAKCHTLTEAKSVGPGLKNVRERWESEELLIAWIKNSGAVLKSGNKYANDLFKLYGTAMPAFPSFSTEDVMDVLAYIDNPPVSAPAAGGDAAPEAAGVSSGKTESNSLIFVLIGAAVVLLILARSLGNVSKSIDRLSKQQAGEEVEAEDERTALKKLGDWIVTHKTITFLICFVLLCAGVYYGYKGLGTIGVYTNYEPSQPIKFSHKLHAGQNGIDCKYCHSTAEKSRHANIPSSSVCMNCHKAVSEGPVYGKQEISKIYAAIGWNPVDKKYFDNYQSMDREEVRKVFAEWLSDTPGGIQEVEKQIQKPVEWIKIHNLPEIAFFSHQQHVKVGKIDCADCHGEVKEMDVVKQFSPLTMGWCVDCHRRTEVQFESNGYYERLHEYYKSHYGEYEMRKGQAFTVEKIGGLDCSKCHY